MSTLPYDSRVEYLQSTGGPYIDTGIETTGDLSVEFEFLVPSSNNNNCLGSIVATDQGYFRHHCAPYSNNSSFYYIQNNGATASVKRTYQGNTWIRVIIDADNGILTVNDNETYNFTPVSASVTTGANYYIFARSGIFQTRASSFKYVKLRRNGVLLRDFIPVRVGYVGYFYDRVSKTLFGNAGTGSFYLGNDVVSPTEILSGHVSAFRRRLLSTYKFPMQNYLCFTALEPSTITRTGTYPANLEYSSDGEQWNTFNDTVTVSLNTDDKCYFRGNNSTLGTSASVITQFVMTGSIAASGNVMSLLQHNGFSVVTAIPSTYCFYKLFYNCTSLVSAPELPAVTLTQYCYDFMFAGCTSLINAPELPATSLASFCYQQMFMDCTSIVYAPELPADILATYCYDGMFLRCTSLKNAPILHAKTLVAACYRDMFNGCTSLKYVVMLATSISAASCLGSYLLNVSAAGALVKDSILTTLPLGTSGKPNGWRCIYYDSAIDKYYLDVDKTIRCDAYGNVLEYINVGYATNGLVFWSDGERQIKSGLSPRIDYTGNQKDITTKIETYGNGSTYVDLFRGSTLVPDSSTLISDISDEFTIEAVYQQKYTNYDGTIKDSPSKTGYGAMIFGFSNNEPFYQTNGQLKVPGGSTIGTEVWDTSRIVHITWTYDGTTFKRYVDGVKDTEINGTFNTSSLTSVYVFGYSPWNGVVQACHNNLRVYKRALSQSEITTNYNTDVTRFGNVNISV